MRGEYMIIRLNNKCIIHTTPHGVKYITNGGVSSYLKTFNIETNELTTTLNKKEALHITDNDIDLVNAFHKMLNQQEQYFDYGTEIIYCEKQSTKIITGGWQISELLHYTKQGKYKKCVLYYPIYQYPEHFIPFKGIHK